jgi:hypothetical protein
MKMKKKVLSAAILAAIAVGPAQAVNISQTGTGEVAIVPYYTVRDGTDTLVSIVNTTGDTKAIKIRFREGMNSREVLDFNIYMSPGDVWTSKITNDPNAKGTVDTTPGGAKITTNDHTCTVPYIFRDHKNGVAFRTGAFDGTVESWDGGPKSADRTREGYIEIIEMGHADEGHPAWDRNGNGVVDSTHVGAGPRNFANINDDNVRLPDNCQGLIDNWKSDGIWQTHPRKGAYGTHPPRGGLMVSAALINVQMGTSIDVPVTMLEDFVELDVLHRDPASPLPTLGEADGRSVILLNDVPNNYNTHPDVNNDALHRDAPGLYVDSWVRGYDAVSAVLAAHSVVNEFTVNPATQAETSWVVTFPTKHFYADMDVDPEDTSRQARAPFVMDFVETPVGTACEVVRVAYFDREETTPVQTGGDADFSPSAPEVIPDYTLCNEVNVVNFESDAGGGDALGSTLIAKSLNTGAWDMGWAEFSFRTPILTTGHDGHNLENDAARSLTPSYNAYVGLPVVGFRATVLGNENVGVGAAYAFSEPHRYLKQVRVITGLDATGETSYTDSTRVITWSTHDPIWDDTVKPDMDYPPNFEKDFGDMLSSL